MLVFLAYKILEDSRGSHSVESAWEWDAEHAVLLFWGYCLADILIVECKDGAEVLLLA